MSKRKIYSILGFISVLILAGIFVKILNSPAEGEIQKSKPSSKSAQKKDEPINQHHQDQHISFDYPAAYSKIKADDAGPGYLVALRFVGPSYKDSLLAIAVKPGNTSTEPSVDQRDKNTSLFEQEPLNLKGSNGVMFKKKGGDFEQSAFVNHNGNIVSIVLTSPTGEDLSKDFLTILGSWEWVR